MVPSLAVLRAHNKGSDPAGCVWIAAEGEAHGEVFGVLGHGFHEGICNGSCMSVCIRAQVCGMIIEYPSPCTTIYALSFCCSSLFT